MAYNFETLSVAVLHSAVRGMHIYRLFPASNIFLDLKLDDKSKFKYSVGVYDVNGGMVGHVASEHAKLVTRWLNQADRRRQCKHEIDLVY